MRFEPTGIAGLFVVRLEWRRDARGGFARLFDAEAFAAHGLPRAFPQTSLSATQAAGTVRGLHFQRPPHAETKLVRCVRGAMFDVVVDLRPGSGTRWQWRSFSLHEDDDALLVVPEGCAHGFQSLADRTDVIYQISVPHAPEFADGLRFDDPVLAIPWPLPVTLLSERDRTWCWLGTRLVGAPDLPELFLPDTHG
jgi:dTDP-4-dehydrorhamnose 3,5-epimerase